MMPGHPGMMGDDDMMGYEGMFPGMEDDFDGPGGMGPPPGGMMGSHRGMMHPGMGGRGTMMHPCMGGHGPGIPQEVLALRRMNAMHEDLYLSDSEDEDEGYPPMFGPGGYLPQRGGMGGRGGMF
jgi:hypothetical protein